ncbi:MAG: hypothetical protein Q9187_008979, partial [Circinaria calcarea]
TTVAEMVPYKNLQPKAFSIMPLVWTIGSIFGPSFGGALANPAARHPKYFGSIRFFKTYPFALPNMVACVFFLVGLSTGILFLRETLETRKYRRDYGRILGKLLTRPFKSRKPTTKWKHDSEQSASLLKHRRMSSITSGNDQYDSEGSRAKNVSSVAPPSYREVFQPQSNINLLAYSLLALHSVAYDQLLPVFLHLTPQPNRSTNPAVHFPFKFAGGFGIDFLIFPPLARKFGVLPCLKAVSLLFPVAYIFTPFTVLLPTSSTRQIAVFMVMLLKCWAGIFAFPCTTILLTNSAGSLRLLGTLNGVATSLSAIGRAAGPSIGGLSFTVGVNIGYIILPWWTLAAFASLGAIPVWWLVEMDGFGGQGESSESEIENDEVVLVEEEGGAGPNLPIRSLTPTITNDTIVEEPGESEDDDFALIDSPLLSARLSKTVSRSSGLNPGSASAAGSRRNSISMQRRMSSPIGMREPVGPGGARRLSNGLGQSMDGLGTGGTSFN